MLSARIILKDDTVLGYFHTQHDDCVGDLNRGRSPVHARVGAGQCPRCLCLRFSFRCSKRASASFARRWLLA